MFQLLDKKFVLVRVSGCGGWISWNYNQLTQAKAEAETEFGNNLRNLPHSLSIV